MPHITPTRTLAVIALVLSSLALAACGGAEARKAKHLEKGHAYLDAANYEKARVEFQNALQIAPTDPEARFENGVVDEKLGRSREAAQFYQNTIDIHPDHVGARVNLARLYLFAGAPDKTLELIQSALAKNPDNAELLTLRAAARVQKNDMSEALADAERAVQLQPSNEDAVSALAGIYSADKSPDKAEALLEGAIQRLPSTVSLRLALAQVYAKDNRPADVERILLDLVHVDGGVAGHRIRLAQFYSQQNQLDAAEQALRDGIKAIPNDRDLKLSLVEYLSSHRTPEIAETELHAMIAGAPADVQLKFALARFYVGNHQTDRAEAVLREVIDTEKLNAAGIAARDRLAGLLAQRNDVKGTEQLIDEVLAKSPRDMDALILRGEIALANRDPKSAIVDLRAVLRDQPNAVGVLRTLARAHLVNGEPAIADETMRRALESNPKDPGVRLDLGQLLAQLGKPDQAKVVLKDLVKDQPNNTQALDALFRVSAGNNDFDTANMAADYMVANEPKSPVGYLYQGIVAEQGSRAADALRLYTRAAELQPEAFEPLQAETRLLVKSNREAEALRLLDELIAKDAKNAFAPDLKGELLFAKKDIDGARTAYQMAIARAPVWWPAYRDLATAQFAVKDADAAVATLRSAEAAVSQPDLPGIDLATYYERIGKPDAAMHEYDGIVKRSPQSDVAANNLAMLLVTYGKDAASLDRAKSLTARFADSSNPSYLDTYAWVLLKHGEAAASLPVLQRVVSQDPNAPVAFYHLGMAQSLAGSKAQAVDNLTRAINSGSRFAGLEEARAMRDKLASMPVSATPTT